MASNTVQKVGFGREENLGCFVPEPDEASGDPGGKELNSLVGPSAVPSMCPVSALSLWVPPLKILDSKGPSAHDLRHYTPTFCRNSGAIMMHMEGKALGEMHCSVV